MGCSPKISNEILNKMSTLDEDLNKSKFYYEAVSLQEKYPELKIEGKIIPASKAKTKLQKLAINQRENSETKIIRDIEGSCGKIRVIRKGSANLMRVSYITLGDPSLPDGNEEAADKILEEFKRNPNFPELNKKFTKDGNTKNGGDLGWFNEKMMAEDFGKAIRLHKKGDIYKAFVAPYGWYIIYNTHEVLENEEFIECIEIKKEDCR